MNSKQHTLTEVCYKEGQGCMLSAFDKPNHIMLPFTTIQNLLWVLIKNAQRIFNETRLLPCDQLAIFIFICFSFIFNREGAK